MREKKRKGVRPMIMFNCQERKRKKCTKKNKNKDKRE